MVHNQLFFLFFFAKTLISNYSSWNQTRKHTCIEYTNNFFSKICKQTSVRKKKRSNWNYSEIWYCPWTLIYKHKKKVTKLHMVNTRKQAFLFKYLWFYIHFKPIVVIPRLFLFFLSRHVVVVLFFFTAGIYLKERLLLSQMTNHVKPTIL